MRTQTSTLSRDPRQFMAYRPMLEAKKQRPAAICTRCNNFSFTTSAFDQPCGRINHGIACKGSLSSVARHGEWQTCHACTGTGWQYGMVCMHCQSLGWRIARRY